MGAFYTILDWNVGWGLFIGIAHWLPISVCQLPFARTSTVHRTR